MAKLDLLTHLRSTLLAHQDEVSRAATGSPGPGRATPAAEHAPPPGWRARTTRPPRRPHEPGG